MNLLFVCSRNRRRSPTAEATFAGFNGVETRSAGISRDADEPLSSDLIEWADVIFVMEPRHRSVMNQTFAQPLRGKRVVCLGIPDDYEYMAPALVRTLWERVPRSVPALTSVAPPCYNNPAKGSTPGARSMPGLLTFEPIYKSMLWGGTRLPELLGTPVTPPLTPADPIGEAWVLSDVEGSLSRVSRGPHRGRTLRELVAEFPRELFGDAPPPDGKFPLLLKFIDAKRELSVQVHPDDKLAEQLKGPGHRGKTEAWVVLDADPATSRVYAGFRPGMTAEAFRAAMAAGTAADTLYSFTPTPGDTIFLRAGTVHAIGADLLIFEVQQTSDITYRLYDWDRTDAKTGLPRELHVEDGLTCSDFAAGPCPPATPVPEADGSERLVACPYFTLHRRKVTGTATLPNARCRVLVAAAGKGTVNGEPITPGTAMLVPANMPAVVIVAETPLTLLDCGLGQP